MSKYEIKTIQKYDSVGNSYWTAYYSEIDECVGGGDTEDEAINDAKENLKIYLEYKNKYNLENLIKGNNRLN